MRLVLVISLSLAIGGLAMAGEALPKWTARIRLEGKGPSIAVEVGAKDKPTARKIIIAQYGDKTAFTSGPVRVKEIKWPVAGRGSVFTQPKLLQCIAFWVTAFEDGAKYIGGHDELPRCYAGKCEGEAKWARSDERGAMVEGSPCR